MNEPEPNASARSGNMVRRVAYAIASAGVAAILLELIAKYTPAYWLFVGGTFVVALVIYGKVN